MAGRHPLKGGAIRLLGSHAGPDGWSFRRAFDALTARYGPLDALGRLEASRAAAAWVAYEAATKALAVARRRREHGKGRRPDVTAIERLSRRAGLQEAGYAAAAARVESLALGRRPMDLARRLAEVAR
jgi:hypothetical protein